MESPVPFRTLAPTLLAITVLSLLMVWVMVQFSRAFLLSRSAPRIQQPSGVSPLSPVTRWGAAYALSWTALIAVFLYLIWLEDAGERPRNLGILALVVAAWFVTHAALLAFILAIIRANQRDFAAGRTRRRKERPGEPDAPAAPAPLLSQTPWESLRHAALLARNVLLILLVVAVGELVPPLKASEAYLRTHQKAFLIPTGIVTAVGFVLFMGGIIHLVLSPKTTDRATFAEVKEAWRRRAWRSSSRWRRMFIIMAGAALMSCGIVGLVIVLAPAGLKALFAAALVYAAVRTAVAFARA